MPHASKRPTGSITKGAVIPIVHFARGPKTLCGVPVEEIGAPGKYQLQRMAEDDEEVLFIDVCQVCFLAMDWGW